MLNSLYKSLGVYKVAFQSNNYTNADQNINQQSPPVNTPMPLECKRREERRLDADNIAPFICVRNAAHMAFEAPVKMKRHDVICVRNA